MERKEATLIIKGSLNHLSYRQLTPLAMYILNIDLDFTTFFQIPIKVKEVKLQISVAVIGVLLAIIGLAIFIYGIYATKPGDLLSSTFLVVIGVFLGMAGLFVLLSQVFRGSILR